MVLLCGGQQSGKYVKDMIQKNLTIRCLWDGTKENRLDVVIFLLSNPAKQLCNA